jgi:hypothetical protein
MVVTLIPETPLPLALGHQHILARVAMLPGDLYMRPADGTINPRKEVCSYL